MTEVVAIRKEHEAIRAGSGLGVDMSGSLRIQLQNTLRLIGGIRMLANYHVAYLPTFQRRQLLPTSEQSAQDVAAE